MSKTITLRNSSGENAVTYRLVDGTGNPLAGFATPDVVVSSPAVGRDALASIMAMARYLRIEVLQPDGRWNPVSTCSRSAAYSVLRPEHGSQHVDGGVPDHCKAICGF